ncbi:MAG: hypothetical protein AB7N80_03375 [Bdellovibrionales bacterium]
MFFGRLIFSVILASGLSACRTPLKTQPTIPPAPVVKSNSGLTILVANLKKNKILEATAAADITVLLESTGNGSATRVLTSLPHSQSKTVATIKEFIIQQTPVKLPDRRKLQVLTVQLPPRDRFPDIHNRILSQLNKVAARLPKTDLVVAIGDFGISRPQEEIEKVSERFLQTNWLVSHQLDCTTPTGQACRGTVLQDGIESFREMILLEKDFYDGLKGWKISRDQVRTFKPEIPVPEEHWPLQITIEPSR